MQPCVAHLLLSLKMGRMMMRSDPAFITLQREDLFMNSMDNERSNRFG
jgi:hypothetical protein